MKKIIIIVSCCYVVFARNSFCEELKWSELISIKGTGVTNCGEPRITNEAWEKCEAWAESKQGTSGKFVIKDVELYNIATENQKGPFTEEKKSCTFRATVKCGYSIDGSLTGKITLPGAAQVKGADPASCGDANIEKHTPEEHEMGKCGSEEEKKKAIAKKKKSKKKNIAIIAVEELPTEPVANAKKPAAKIVTPAVAAASSLGGKNKWSELLQIEGKGVTNCGTPRIMNEAWDKCESWARKKQTAVGKVVIKDVELYNIATENEQSASWSQKQSCYFFANLKCAYSIEKDYSAAEGALKIPGKVSIKKVPDVPQLKSDTAEITSEEIQKEPEEVTVKQAAPELEESQVIAVEHAAEGNLKWSELISIKGIGITNCGTARITNEAWEACEAWAGKKKKLHPVINDVMLYNVASEEGKESCTFNATLKCGYSLGKEYAAADQKPAVKKSRMKKIVKKMSPANSFEESSVDMH